MHSTHFMFCCLTRYGQSLSNENKSMKSTSSACGDRQYDKVILTKKKSRQLTRIPSKSDIFLVNKFLVLLYKPTTGRKGLMLVF